MDVREHGNDDNHSQLLTNVTGVVDQNAPDIVVKFCCEFSNSKQLLFWVQDRLLKAAVHSLHM